MLHESMSHIDTCQMLLVLRYAREELLAMHVQNTIAPTYTSETMIISEYCLPPVGTFPFDHEEIYKQWALNKNRGRGRGRGMNTGPQERGQNHRNDPDKKVMLYRVLLQMLNMLAGSKYRRVTE